MRRVLGNTLLWLLSMTACNAGPVTLVRDGVSTYTIVIPAEASKAERDAASVLQRYLALVSGATLPIVSESDLPKGAVAAGPAAAGPSAPGAVSAARGAIFLGKTAAARGAFDFSKIHDDGFFIATRDDALFIAGAHGRSTVYGVYEFLDRYLGCKKYDAGPAVVPAARTVTVDGGVYDLQNPSFSYRQTYYPPSSDPEYLEWHHLHQFEDLWGVWGHSYFKFVPPSTYWAAHPEYYALVDGRRRPTQLCLSNDTVFQLTVAFLKERMARNPDALYWSIAANDDNGYCTCDRCRRADTEEGSPSGSLIRFVNRVAEQFPDKVFTTLAYGYTSKAPLHTAPASNVYVMLSSIDAPRQRPFTLANLDAWARLTPRLMLWDYTTQFTNYAAPFPDYAVLQPNLQYALQHGVRGVFEQGSGETYGDMGVYNSYVQAALLWNPSADVHRLTTDFCNGYYGPAAGSYIAQYLEALSAGLARSGMLLDIYGNPVNEYNSFLTPEAIDALSTLLDKAEAAAGASPAPPRAAQGPPLAAAAAPPANVPYAARVAATRLPLEYTVLQQSRFYGIEPHGYLQPDGQGGYTVRPNWSARVDRFVAACLKAGVKELSEGGLSPAAYAAEWKTIFAHGWEPTKALHTAVTLAHPYVEDYPAKGERTLTDGMPGFNDFSYNWLCFYGVDMGATIDLGTVQPFSHVHMHFLYDPRHWIFLPREVRVETSVDGTHFTSLGVHPYPAPDEDYTLSIVDCAFTGGVSARFIRVTAVVPAALPEWRPSATKKAMICCDEVWVQ
ncbi:DUF4838 domain-containing protein [Dinghuibacter silviterrae]|uniref:Uncharacterized protein DUF4838 n=1 Tax=Dinghuibacter silviterrae TaxID=1539049 RepID=A0A4R8DII6_9BACT|nr:DUF4838 domain-containing protein [Dinghuibacter silviterrae]TDW97553.1 uncharacterized protein DUF4838 [Dinghuibacter silviterrae]